MATLPYWLRSAVLLALLLLARQGRSQNTAFATQLVANETDTGSLGFHTPDAVSAPTSAAPLVPQFDATTGWLQLTGTLPATATYTADVLAANGRSLAHRTWHGLTPGPVILALNLRTVPTGAYTLVLSQDDQQWALPLARR